MAILVAAVLGALVLAFASVGAMTSTTALGRDPSRWKSIEQPTNAEIVLANRTRDDGDAGPIYRAAGDAYLARLSARRPYDDFLENSRITVAPPGELPLLARLDEAANVSRATLYGESPGLLIRGEGETSNNDALYALGLAAVKQAALLATRWRTEGSEADAREARALYEAAYALGLAMYEDRVIHREFEYGYRLMSEALGGLAALAEVSGDTARANELRRQRVALTDYIRNRTGPVWAAIGTINDLRSDDDAADIHPGDVAAIALSDEADPLWRVEAILRLGQYTRYGTRAADRAGAERILRELNDTVTDERYRIAVEHALGE